MKYHVFTANDGAFCVEADGYRDAGSFTEFFTIVEEGTETTFPSWWRKLLGAKKAHRRVMTTTTVEYVRSDTITRLRFVRPASAIEAAAAGETTKIGSTEGESAVANGETPTPRAK